jgi:hypothetical protein
MNFSEEVTKTEGRKPLLNAFQLVGNNCRNNKNNNNNNHQQQQRQQQTSPSYVIAFLRMFYQIASGLHFFGFRNNLFTEQCRQPCINTQPGGPDPCVYVPPVRGWPSYTPRHWVPSSSPSTPRRATVEVF